MSITFRTFKMSLHGARKCFVPLLVVLLAICQPSVSQTPDEGFQNFLRQAILDFPEWMTANGKDLPIHSNTPVPLLEDTSLIFINGTVKTQDAEGYISTVSTQSLSVYADLVRSYFGTTFSTGYGIILDGEYEVEGNVFSTIPVQGSGHISAGNRAYISYRADFSSFNVVNDHVEFVDENQNMQVSLRQEELQFDGLNADGYESTVNELLQRLYGQSGGSTFITNKLGADLMTYLKNIFAETKFSDIIKTLPPPSTPNPDPTTDNPITSTEDAYPTTYNPDPTATTTTTTTHSPSSTIDPLNPCQIFDNLGKAKVTSLVENILKNITVKENGKLITYTKKMVIMELREEQCDED